MQTFRSAILFAAIAFAVSHGQQAVPAPQPSAPSLPLPSAPTTKPSFTLPPPVYAAPSAPVPDDQNKLVCDGPRQGVFAQPTASAAEAKTGEARSYGQLITTQIYGTWRSRLPREAKDAWAKGRIVRVRFVVMRDGSYSPPEVTVSSGKSSYDYAALDAVRSLGAFPPLPATLTEPLPFCLTFKANTDMPDTPQGWYRPAIK